MKLFASELLCRFDCIIMRLSGNRKYIGCKNLSDLPKGFTVTCHAGALHTAPNSLQSISAAIKWGAQIVEFDVSFRPDGTPVIIHDSSPSQDRGVLLKDALDIVAKDGECRINLDIKSTANLAAVDKLVKEAGLFDRVFYTGVFADWVDAVKRSSQIPYYLNHKITVEEAADPDAAQAVADKAKALGAIGINSHFGNASKMFVDKMRDNGLLVSLWTVKKAADMLNVIDLKPDNITTKKPHIIKMFIGK